MTPRILHLGLGAFHRAHQAPYTQDAGGWAITAVSMRNPSLARDLAAQAHVYTLVTRAPDGPTCAPITVIDETLALSEDRDAVLDRMAAPETHIVTLTVTEKGYGADLARLLCDGLARRRAAGGAGLTLMSCDNLPDNGGALRTLVADAADADLGGWIHEACTFPSSMVDRITPATTPDTIAIAGGDACAVETEPFRQWVIEDAFAGPRPDWARVGATLVADVAPYEAMKLRMLNGAHSRIAFTGAVLGLLSVRDVMADPDLARDVRVHMDAAAQTLPPLPEIDLGRYAQDLMDRFANPAIDHRCLQIAMDGSQKMPQRIFAPARDALARGQDCTPFASAVAAWLVFLRGAGKGGEVLPLEDPLASLLRPAVAPDDPEERLDNLARIPGLAHHDMLGDGAFRRAVIAAEAVLRAQL